MAKPKPPEIITFTEEQLVALLLQLQVALPAPTYQLVESLLKTLLWIMQVLAEKKISLRRLHKIIFGSTSEKAKQLFPPIAPPPDASAPPKEKLKRKGHGRRKADEYTGAQRVHVPHLLLKVGDICRQCLKGKLYPLAHPALLVRIVAHPLIGATIYELDQLRCALCGALFTAPPPPEAGVGKYDPNVGTMLALQRYGVGVPMYRLAKWQAFMGVPLPAGTQWKLIDEAAPIPERIYETLITVGAQGHLIHNDDTHMRVQSLSRDIAAQEPGERTGIFTTSLVCQVALHQVALFFTGRQHAGENLEQLLQQRASALSPPLQMCDALARNRPQQSQTDMCNCLLHGRRNFVDEIENFPPECRHLIQSLGAVYHVDAQCQQAKLSPAERLVAHQTQSGPIMDELQQWMKTQLDQKLVEPNSGLGQAFHYMLKHWGPLTRFLHVEGAPLDNNICERALKMAILHRKNSLSYKTTRGARVGDVYMSVIHTCQLNGVNPFVYLTALQTHAQAVLKDPTRWLPWNYQENLAATDTS